MEMRIRGRNEGWRGGASQSSEKRQLYIFCLFLVFFSPQFIYLRFYRSKSIFGIKSIVFLKTPNLLDIDDARKGTFEIISSWRCGFHLLVIPSFLSRLRMVLVSEGKPLAELLPSVGHSFLY